MSVNTVESTIEYTADGVDTIFIYPFRILVATDLEVYLDDVLQASAYSVTDVDNDSGGTVVFDTAPPATTKVVLWRNVPQDRTINYTTHGLMDGPTFNRDHDRGIMIQQDFARAVVKETPDGKIDAKSKVIKDVADPTNNNDAINLGYMNANTGGQAKIDAELSAVDAQTAQALAEAAQAAAELAYDNFDDRYLGEKASPPALDNDGNTLLTGALYWSTATNKMYVWGGSSWTALGLLPGIDDQADSTAISINANEVVKITNVLTHKPPTTAGTAAAYTVTWGITALETDRVYTAQIHIDNTGACTLNPDAIGVTNIKLIDGTNPTAAQLLNGSIAEFVYDGTNLVLQNPIPITVTNGDSHDHNGGDGAQIPTGGIANGAITGVKISKTITGSAHTNIAAGGGNYTPPASSINYVTNGSVYLQVYVAGGFTGGATGLKTGGHVICDGTNMRFVNSDGVIRILSWHSF